MNRRSLLKGLPVVAGLSLSGTGSAQNEVDQEDLVVREVDIMSFNDGIIWRENDQQIAVPIIYPAESAAVVKGIRSAQALMEAEMEPPTFPLLPLFDGDALQAVAFNFYLPEPGDEHLFHATADHESPMLITADPALAVSVKNGTRAVSNRTDGTIRKKWDQKAFRFEAHGIVRRGGNLNPTCIPGAEEGIWIKLDLPGIDSFNPLEWDRWHTYAEGSLAAISGRPGVYQFHWTKPRICSTGNSERNAVYNGIRQMIRDLVQDVLGTLGRYLDELLRFSHTIASFIADSLIKWIRGSQSNPGGGNGGGGTQNPNPPTFTLAAHPTSASVRRGASTSFQVTVTPSNGFNGRVSLTARGNTGSSVSFYPNVLTGGGSSTLTIRTGRTSRVGNHTITVSATSASITKTLQLGLTILN